MSINEFFNLIPDKKHVKVKVIVKFRLDKDCECLTKPEVNIASFSEGYNVLKV